jgi:hypothetical protein
MLISLTVEVCFVASNLLEGGGKALAQISFSVWSRKMLPSRARLELANVA